MTDFITFCYPFEFLDLLIIHRPYISPTNTLLLSIGNRVEIFYCVGIDKLPYNFEIYGSWFLFFWSFEAEGIDGEEWYFLWSVGDAVFGCEGLGRVI